MKILNIVRQKQIGKNDGCRKIEISHSSHLAYLLLRRGTKGFIAGS